MLERSPGLLSRARMSIVTLWGYLKKVAAEQIDAESATRKLTLDMHRAYSKGAPEFQGKKKLSKPV
jgi:hypothetical protein